MKPPKLQNSLNDHVTQRIVEERKRRQVPRYILAGAIGIDPKNMWRYESGHYQWTVDKVLFVAAGLGCHYTDLLYGYEPPSDDKILGMPPVDASNPNDFVA